MHACMQVKKYDAAEAAAFHAEQGEPISRLDKLHEEVGGGEGG